MTKLGAKAENLIRLRDEFRFAVPEFVVIPFAEALEGFDQTATDAGSARWKPDALERFSRDIAARGFGKVSFRTSAAMEDLSGNSFAGQYETFLDIEFSTAALEVYVLKCFASMFTQRVREYASAHGLAAIEIDGCVIVQRMFYGDSCGVLFSENGQGQLAISAVDGWRNTAVEGESSIELAVSRDGIGESPLSPAMRELCQKALQVEAAVGAPVDIEWSVQRGKLVFLQFRPVTVRNLDYLLTWDSTNISENYPGVTLPLTYSVIRQLYAGVYPAFLRMVGASEKALADHEATFDNMLGYLNGHVYYRIGSWYESVKLLPGRRNQEYFEAMLNPVQKRGAANQRSRFDLRSLMTIARFLWLLGRSERLSRRFRDEINAKIEFFGSYQLGYINAGAIMAAGKKIRSELLSAWAVSILNDVKLMVFHGVLKRVFFKGEHQAEYLTFLQGLTDRASIKPLEALAELGRVLNEALATENVSDIDALRATSSWPRVKASADAYNREFGARTPDELKLENQRLTDSITSLLQLASRATETRLGKTEAAKAIWPEHVPWVMRPALKYVAENTRRAIDWRERFRFNRAQTFDLTRNAFNAIGEALAAENLIAEPTDIFWLTEHEIDELVNGHAWEYNALEVVAQRKKKFTEYAGLEMPLGLQGAGRIAPRHLIPVMQTGDPNALAGNGVAPGELTAEVVVATAFDPNLDVRGKILVVHHIDPGWTLLFTQAAGIVAERGNALSHAAIIAREIGIPAIVATPNATKLLQTGDVISINGITGGIERETH